MKLLRYVSLMLCVSSVTAARATTVIPPTFEQLVNDAELIFQGTVTATQSRWAGGGTQRHIVTDITFRIDDSIKGTLGGGYTIQVVGGTVDGQTLEVSDSPKFKIGDREILFVEHNGHQFVPLVGIMHGRFHIRTDADGREVVAKDNGAPLANVSKLGTDEQAAVTGAPLTANDFKSAIRKKLAQLQK